MSFVHQRHQPPNQLNENYELCLVVPKLRSNVNLSRIVRTAGCCGIRRIIVGGNPKIDSKIARDSVEFISIERHRTILPVLPKLKADGYELIGVEQTTNSTCIYGFSFPQKSALIVGHERLGIEESVLNLLDVVVEIPVFGQPCSYNVATATTMILYEFCRQAYRSE